MFTMNFHIRYSEIDRSGCLSMDGLLRIFQDSGYAHAEARNMGIGRTIPEGRTWYLVSWNILSMEPPKVGEDVVVETWFYFLKGPLARKSLVMKNAEGTVIAAADTTWVYMDVETQTPIDAPEDQWPAYDFGEAYPMPKDTLGRRIPRLDADNPNVENMFPTHIRKCHVDTNKHANNTKLTEFAMELVDAESDRKLRGLRAEYVKQVHLSDNILPLVERRDGCIIVNLTDEDGQVMACFVFQSIG